MTSLPMRPSARYFLGADVGSTKTHALIADEQGRAVGFGDSGPGNPDTVGHSGLAAVLQEAVFEALAMARISEAEIVGAGFGIAGYDWRSQRPAMLRTIATLGLNAPVEVVNDAMVGLLAGAEQGWGVAVVAGSSCNCWGRDQTGQVGRMTGFSWLGESAGASEILVKALQAIALEWTRRGPATRLTPAFVEVTETHDVGHFLEGLTTGQIHVGLEMAPLVFQVAAEGDHVARETILWAGRELGSMASGVIRQLGFEALAFELVLAGSFFNGSPLLAETIRETVLPVAPGVRLVRLHAPPVVGAVVLGMEQGGVAPAGLRTVLVQTAGELLKTEEL